ncbi:MAG: hypothetical protein HY881_13585 [Deltaproteobacteria bacterium]|nr:hypothetical protein [Deltaproteobacteria bacterium]
MEHEALLTKMMNMLGEEDRSVLQKRIEDTLARHAKGDGRDEARALRYLQDLDIFLHMPGADFMYARGIAETLRVGEEIFELAYVMKRAMERATFRLDN